MDQKIASAVGAGGANRAEDVRKIQTLLNKAPAGWGGSSTPLKVDGLIGPKTIEGIKFFQLMQLGSVFDFDGRVDPGGRTLKRLNQTANTSERPGAFFKVSAEPIDHVVQKTNMVCWAAAGTMLVAARDQRSTAIETVMKTADRNDAGPNYLAMFKNNQGLPPASTRRFTQAIGLRVAPPVSFSLAGWRALIQSRGAVGIVGLSPFLHIRVVTALQGDGTVFGSLFTVHDPGKKEPYLEMFVTLAERYEAAATVNDKMDQVWHQ